MQECVGYARVFAGHVRHPLPTILIARGIRQLICVGGPALRKRLILGVGVATLVFNIRRGYVKHKVGGHRGVDPHGFAKVEVNLARHDGFLVIGWRVIVGESRAWAWRPLLGWLHLPLLRGPGPLFALRLAVRLRSTAISRFGANDDHRVGIGVGSGRLAGGRLIPAAPAAIVEIAPSANFQIRLDLESLADSIPSPLAESQIAPDTDADA